MEAAMDDGGGVCHCFAEAVLPQGSGHCFYEAVAHRRRETAAYAFRIVGLL